MIKVLNFNTGYKEVENITFRYDDSYKSVIEDLEKEVRTINELGNRWFDGETNSTLTVYIPKSFIANYLLQGSNAIFFPKSNIAILDGRISEDNLLHAFTHEYAHFHMMNKMDNEGLQISDVPDWFHEGIAEAFAHRFAPVPFVEAIDWWDVKPFHEMEFKGVESGEVISERYIMAHFSVEKLIKEHGENVINSLIERTKENRDFTGSFNSLTGQQLEEYHEWLLVNHQFFEKIDAMYADGDYEKLKKILIQYDDNNGPYYYRANNVYSLLRDIYVREEKWDKAINVIVKSSYYSQHSALWKEASEYALKLDDVEKALYFAQKAVDTTDEFSEDYFSEWLDDVRKQAEVLN